jgi:hypothetical protein
VYAAFREWVEEQTGKQYNEVGNALERAMLEYMDNDRYQRIEDELGEVKADVRKNQALLRKLAESGTAEKQKGDFSAGGNAPGSRRKREAIVIAGLLGNEVETVHLETLKEAIQEFAKVSSDPTIRDYVDALTDTAAFQSHPRGNTWRFDHDGAREVCRNRGVESPQTVTQ